MIAFCVSVRVFNIDLQHRMSFRWSQLQKQGVNDFSREPNNKYIVLGKIWVCCGKAIFSQASVSNSVHRGGIYLSACWDTPPGQTLPGRHPSWQTYLLADSSWHTPRWTDTSWADPPFPTFPEAGSTPPWRPLQRTVRIVMECFLVSTCCFIIGQYWVFIKNLKFIPKKWTCLWYAHWKIKGASHRRLGFFLSCRVWRKLLAYVVGNCFGNWHPS